MSDHIAGPATGSPATTERTFTLLGVTFDLRLTLLIVFSTVVPMLDFYGHSPVSYTHLTLPTKRIV